VLHDPQIAALGQLGLVELANANMLQQ